jgi:hypothetical protein
MKSPVRRLARQGTVRTSVRLVVRSEKMSSEMRNTMVYVPGFIHSRTTVNSQPGGPYGLMQPDPPTATNKKRSSDPVSHKTLCRPLLPSGPGGVEQRLVAQDLTSMLKENSKKLSEMYEKHVNG